jgi:hypothetical protein
MWRWLGTPSCPHPSHPINSPTTYILYVYGIVCARWLSPDTPTHVHARRRRRRRRRRLRERTDYHLWGGDYTFSTNPKEQRQAERALQRSQSLEPGSSTGWQLRGVQKQESLGETLSRERRETAVPSEAWSGLAMASTWKPSTDDPSGRTPLELKGVHQVRGRQLD